MLPSLVAQLIIITIVAVSVKRIQLPYTVALVTSGLVLGSLSHHVPWATRLQLTPDFLFFGLLPPLLFEGSLGLSWQQLRQKQAPIVGLATLGLLVSTGLVGLAMHTFFGLGWSAALIFGTLISATDPISVLAVFRQLRVPRSLAVVVEGESLLNDGVAAVLFAVFTGIAAGEALSVSGAISHFLFESVGGAMVGAAVAFLIGEFTRRIDDHLVEITLSTIAAYGSYLLAHQLHVSGVVASIAAGIYYGNWVLHRGLSPVSQTLVHSFWEYVGFLCNSLVFLEIGAQVDLEMIVSRGPTEVAVFVIVMLGRLATVLVCSPLLERNFKHWLVVTWGGLKGSIAIALALTLSIPERQEILTHTFAVVIFSLYLQGFSMKLLLTHLGVVETDVALLEYEQTVGEIIALEHSRRALVSAKSQFHIHEQATSPLLDTLNDRREQLCHRLEDMCQNLTHVQEEQKRDAQAIYYHAYLSGLREAKMRGIISEASFTSLQAQLVGRPDQSGSNDEGSDTGADSGEGC